MSYRISVDTGGTFTDVVIADDEGNLHVGKALTTYTRAFDGISQALGQVAESLDVDPTELLRRTSHFAYGTTRATNAIVEAKTARTAFLTTAGFPDVLLLREGGKLGGPFSPRPFPAPYVPRYLTFEVEERIDSDGSVHWPLDEACVAEVATRCRQQQVEAVGVSLLWSTVNPAHELRVGELLAEHLPGVPVTLSHQLNPVLREYRRASSTVIDASLKPLMQDFLGTLVRDLRAAGFDGRLLVSTSFGGSWPVPKMVERPIYSVGSGPSMAPVAALHAAHSALEEPAPDLLVCDTGGTTFDVGLVSEGQVHYSAETWLGEQWTGHITGTRSVDVRSIGAGGGSVVSVDGGGLMRVGPQSAGADPGPACYGRGGELPTVTDAALVLGYLDPVGFLGGRLHLDESAARAVLEPVAARLGGTVEDTARGAMVVATQNIVSAIREMTVSQGIDPRELTIVAGGGASGLNIVQIARELGCDRLVLPATAGALAASGALHADVISDFAVSCFAETRGFDADQVNATLAAAERQADEFLDEIQALRPVSTHKSFAVDARYPGQVWELELPLSTARFHDQADVSALTESFHQLHRRVFAVQDPDQYVECLVWKVRATATLDRPRTVTDQRATGRPEPAFHRQVHFADETVPSTPIYQAEQLAAGGRITGPAVVLQATMTLVLDPGAELTVARDGSYLVDTGPARRPAGDPKKEEVAR